MEYLGIGVDAFGFMYQAIKHKSCVQKFSVVSPISVTEIITYLDPHVKALFQAG